MKKEIREFILESLFMLYANKKIAVENPPLFYMEVVLICWN